MKPYKVLCYQSAFREFREKSNGYIRELPANDNDPFALLMAVAPGRRIGFSATPEGRYAISALVSRSYSLDCDKKAIKPPEESHNTPLARLMFRDNNSGFEGLLSEHEKYELDVKKHNVLSRYKQITEPSRSTLSCIFQGDGLSINHALYTALQDNCHYTLTPVLSGEHGNGAFTVFGKNLDFFFDEFRTIVGDTAEFEFVEHSGLLYD